MFREESDGTAPSVAETGTRGSCCSIRAATLIPIGRNCPRPAPPRTEMAQIVRAPPKLEPCQDRRSILPRWRAIEDAVLPSPRKRKVRTVIPLSKIAAAEAMLRSGRQRWRRCQNADRTTVPETAAAAFPGWWWRRAYPGTCAGS